MENARRIAELEDQIATLADAVHTLSAANSKSVVLSFALEAMLRQRGKDPEFCGLLRSYVDDFLATNSAAQEIEYHVLGQMNALLEAAGEQPPIPD